MDFRFWTFFQRFYNLSANSSSFEELFAIMDVRRSNAHASRAQFSLRLIFFLCLKQKSTNLGVERLLSPIVWGQKTRKEWKTVIGMYTSSVWLRVIKRQRVLQQKEKYFYSQAATVGSNIQSVAWPQHWIKFFYRLDSDEARELYLIWILLIKLKVSVDKETHSERRATHAG